MSRLIVVGLAVLTLLVPLAASEQDADPRTPGWQGLATPTFGSWGFDMNGRDTSVAPGDDFFRFANGRANDAIEIPADRSNYGSFAILRELSENRLTAMMAALVARRDLAPGSDEAKIANAYRSFIDEARVEALDGQPLQPLLAAIRAADTHEKMAIYMGGRRGGAGASVVDAVIAIDAKHPTRYVTAVAQSGLGLPNRDYYLDARYATQKGKYRQYMARMLGLVGWADPPGTADAILAFEDRIATAHWTPIENRDRDKTYNESTPARLISDAPGFDFRAYLGAAGLGAVERVVVRQNTAIPKIAAIYADTPVAVLQAWQAFHTIDDLAPTLSRRFSDAAWELRGRDLSGELEQRSREKRAVTFADGALGEAIGRAYVARYFPADSKAKMIELVANLRRALSSRIDNLSWMSAATKAAAKDKLAKFTVKIGYPDRWRDYSGLDVRPDDLVGNAERIAHFEWQYDLDRMNGPVDKAEWNMTPQTVNAYYNSSNNEIVFPAAILQPPFFDPTADPAVNYGGIGAVIGHEIGHGFDDQGSKSDGDGVLRSWWTPEDRAAFDALTVRLGAQYDRYEILPGYHVQGSLTMGENIGDAAGVAVGLSAYHLSLGNRPAPILDGTTGDQRFFYSWAQIWNAKYREEALKRQVATDPHSPAVFRTIGPLRNVDAWYDAFNVRPGEQYYLPPEERVRIW